MQHGTGKARDTKSRLPVRFWRNNDEHTAMLTDGVQSPCKPWDEIGCSLVELNKLMEFRKTEAVEKIHSTYGGVAGLCRRLQTDPVNGLPNNAVEREKRKRHFGTNEILRPPSKKFLHLMWNALQDPTLLILVAAAALSLGLTFYHPPVRDASEEAANWIEVVAILAAVVVVVLVTAVNDWCKERQFRGFQSKMVREQRFSVIRGGVAHNVAVKELVVGDVCRVKYGDLLPADGVLIHSNDLRIDESPLTGEPDEELVAKSPDANPILFAGTHVMEGSGRYLLTAVGANSRAGIIMALLCAEEKGSSSPKSAEDDSFTPSVLSGKLSKLAALLGYFGIAIASLTILILITRFGITEYVINKRPVKATDLSHLVNYIIIGVTILMIVVPEGLPLAKTLSLAYSVKKMMKDNNLVRHLDACETMGNATTICSNKTGTLTTNIMTAVQLYANGILHKQLPPASLDARAREFLVEGICVNSSYSSNIDGPREHMAQVGNTTECALLGFVSDQGADYREIRAAHPEESFMYTFNSSRKSMMTVIRLANGGYRIHAKGAAEHILARSSFMFGENGRIELLDNEGRSRINMEIIERMASEGLRTIALCYKDFVPMGTKERENEEEFCSDINWEDEELVFSEMTTVAIVAIHDPVRPEVPAAIAKMQRAGITVRMVTGDNINTARSVATSCGILKPGEDFLALESSEFNARIRDEQGDMDQKRLDEIWPKLRVLARAHPSDKYLLVKGIIDSNLSQYREVVAVTGDCARDAPALQKADVGFAMGITGTDVAKEASDIIITDDNFTSIVKAVMWGRNVYDSIAKFLQFQLTVNVVAVTLAFIGCCALSDSPLKAVQMLWVNMVQDTLASLALATETPTNQLLKRQPYGRTRPLLSTTMVKNILGHALYQLVILLFLLFRGNTLWFLALPLAVANSRRPSAHHTIIFNAFMMMTLCNMINARKIHGERNVFHGILRNPLFCSIWTFSLLAHAFMVQFGGRWLQTRPLTPVQWAFCIVLGVGDLFWGQLIASITSPTALLKIFSFSRK